MFKVTCNNIVIGRSQSIGVLAKEWPLYQQPNDEAQMVVYDAAGNILFCGTHEIIGEYLGGSKDIVLAIHLNPDHMVGGRKIQRASIGPGCCVSWWLDGETKSRVSHVHQLIRLNSPVTVDELLSYVTQDKKDEVVFYDTTGKQFRGVVNSICRTPRSLTYEVGINDDYADVVCAPGASKTHGKPNLENENRP